MHQQIVVNRSDQLIPCLIPASFRDSNPEYVRAKAVMKQKEGETEGEAGC